MTENPASDIAEYRFAGKYDQDQLQMIYGKGFALIVSGEAMSVIAGKALKMGVSPDLRIRTGLVTQRIRCMREVNVCRNGW